MRGHVKNIGTSVETMENRMRNGLSEIYFSKTKDIVNACRSVNTLVDENHKKEISSEIHKRLLDKSKTDCN
jgi:capping protein beta